MNDLDRQFGRLLRNAATVPKSDDGPVLPFAVEARVLAAWRAGRAGRADGSGEIAGLLRFFRYGFACACAIAIVAVGLSWRGVQSEATDEFALSNAEMNVAMLR